MQNETGSIKTKGQRVVDRIVGRKNAEESIKSLATMFNTENGAGRMVVSKGGLRARDEDGSGEYYEAKCANSNEAISSDDEVYEVLTNW